MCMSLKLSKSHETNKWIFIPNFLNMIYKKSWHICYDRIEPNKHELIYSVIAIPFLMSYSEIVLRQELMKRKQN